MNLDTTRLFEHPAYPGFKATIRVLNVIERAKRDLPVAAARSEFQRLHREKNTLLNTALNRPPDSFEPATVEQIRALPAATQDRLYALATQAQLLQQAELMPADLRAAIVSIDGLSFNGAAATIDSLIAHAPDTLLDSLYEAVSDAAGLTAVQEKNSPSRGYSGNPQDTSAGSITVANAA